MTTLTIPRATLLPALAIAQKATERKSTIPILGNLLLTVAAGELSLTGSDLDVEITATVPCPGAPDMALTLPAGLLHDAVKKLPAGVDIRIEAKDTGAVLSAGRSRFTMQALPASDFPRLDAGGGDETAFALPAGALARMVARLAFAISSEETRYYLNGIHWHVSGPEGGEASLAMVATDGHRLARLAVPMPQGAEDLPPIIVPRRAIDLLDPFEAAKGDVAIRATAGRIVFETPPRGDGAADGVAVRMVSKLIDGTFPDYRRVIPADTANRFTVGREALSAAVDRVAAIAQGARGSAVKFTFAADGVTIWASNPDAGSAEDHVAVDAAEGEEISIGFNGRYVLDMLAASTADRLTFVLGDPGSPARAEPEGDAATLFVIMPMRV